MPCKSVLCVEGRSWYVTPRLRAEGETPPDGAVSLHMARTNHSQRGTARARGKLPCCASSREISGARVCHAKAGCALEALAGTSHSGRAPKERGLLPV